MTNKSSLAYLGLGSNLGNRSVFLSSALRQLNAGDLTVIRSSEIYESAPIGPVQDQPPYLNLVVEIRTGLAPVALLHRILAVEIALGRKREIPKGPRTIDIDLLLYEERIGRWPGLTLPHAEMSQRAFVLLPLLELNAELVDPRDGRRFAEHLEMLGETQEIQVIDPSQLSASATLAPQRFADH